ncbi:YczE/YyaS/YitT family protein [Rhodopseudomonas palustris]|uniref:YitT family protein n=1 Tax=Rhodopseudomonas palustris (strain BisB18) TaxID=316056 RepID=Q210Z6_RHOPB
MYFLTMPDRGTRLPSFSQLFIYLVGCVVFAAGAFMFIYSNLGTDPLDVFSLGLQRYLPITIGIAQTLIAVICLGIVALWTRRRPLLSPIFTFFFCGSLIDLLRLFQPADLLGMSSMSVMLFGTLLCAYGSSLIIMSGFGIRGMDLLAIEMTKHWRLPFWSTKGALEAVLLISGWLMGGPVGVGTLSFLIGVNAFIQPMMWANARILRLRNFGLPPREAMAETLPI